MISPLANISADAKLGQNVVIDSFSTIFEDVEIGDGTRIHPNVTIYPGTRIGKNCEIFPGAVIGVVPQDLKFNNEYTTVEIGDHTIFKWANSSDVARCPAQHTFGFYTNRFYGFTAIVMANSNN